MNDLNDDLHEGEPPALPVEPKYYPTHPLFPLPEGVHETKEIHQITFDRWDHQGRKERCPHRFPASELTSLAQVIDMFGGGTYQFIAFDSRGNFSRWTPEKDKIRSSLPCRPFRQIELSETPTESPQAKPSAMPHDYMGLLVEQSIAAQERSDRLLATLLERIAGASAASAAGQPSVDPMAMLTGFATVMEKLRPPPSGDMIGQLSGLVGIAKQLGGKGQSAAVTEDDKSIQPLLNMVTQVMSSGANAPAPVAAPSQPTPPLPTQPANLMWVMLPQLGPVLMRPDQAMNAYAALATPTSYWPGSQPHVSAPTTASAAAASVPQPTVVPPTPSAPTRPSFASSRDDVAARLRKPSEQLALKEAIERVLGASLPSASAPPRAPMPAAPIPAATMSAASMRAPVASVPAAPIPETAAPAPEVPAPACAAPRPSAVIAPEQASPASDAIAATPAPASEPSSTLAAACEVPSPISASSSSCSCIVCGEPAFTDPLQRAVLVCRRGHRSLASPRGLDEVGDDEADDDDEAVALSTIPLEDLEDILGNEESLNEMLPEMIAAFRDELAARRAGGSTSESPA